MISSANPVLVALAQARLRAAPVFAKWCELNGVPFCPAAPADVTHFVKDCASLGIERLWSSVQEVSKLHTSRGLADPTLGDAVAVAVSNVAQITPPRSWPNHWKRRFCSLPYDLQVFVASHDGQREKALRRAQNEAAAARKMLDACQQPQTKTSEEFQVNEAEQNHVS